MSTRYAPLVLAMLLLALVPTVIHSYVRVTIDDGLRAEAIPSTLPGFTASAGRRDPTWGKRRFDSDDWIERRYSTAGDELSLIVVRSFDLKALYHHPELAVAYNTPFSASSVRRFRQRPDIPVYVLRGDDGAAGLYALHYDGRFIEHPVWFQIRTAGELLFSGRKAMTLLFVHDTRMPRQADPADTGAARLLFAAIERFTQH